MESNEQTELTSKMDTDSWIEGKMTAQGGGSLAGTRFEQKGNRTYWYGQECGDCGEGGRKG